MHCRRFLPSLFPLPFFLLLLVIVRIPQSLGNPDGYNACRDARFKCGRISVGYPFSGDGIPVYCGHPRLQLHCEERIATIEILDVRYQVLHIYEEKQILRIARQDFLNDFCHPHIKSSALDSSLFAKTRDCVDVTLLYDCPSVIPSNIGRYTCNKDSGSRKDVSIILLPAVDPGECASNITVPIPQTSLQGIGNNSSRLEEALKEGFEVQWKLDSKGCQKCRDTGGTCFFDLQNQPNCYCPNDTGLSLKECPFPNPSQANTDEQVRIPQSLGNPDGYNACRDARFKCGRISVGYPFSGDGIPVYCGHPRLQLHCEERIATIEILDVRYQVLHIYEEKQILRIARQDFLNDFCHPHIKSSALDSSLFAKTRDCVDVTLLYDCPSVIPSNIGRYTCNKDSGSRKDVSIILLPAVDPGECASNITVPIPQTSLQGIGNNSSRLEEALKEGFEVQWKLDSKGCQKCRDTGGTCFFDLQNQPNCYCPNDPGLSLKECPFPNPSQANTDEQGLLLNFLVSKTGMQIAQRNQVTDNFEGFKYNAELGSGK
ncbi:Wall-associated receptor kinase [Theobroma cacao]|nr:Wall-associated receptor kinase [Theobroma cacao]